MARQRYIYPSIWTSPAFADLTFRQRLLFIGMFSLADDYGNGHAEPTRLRITIFPLDDGLRPQELGKDCAALEAGGLARFYEANGRRYYHLPGWTEYQNPRHFAKTTIPKPPLKTNEIGLFSTQSDGGSPQNDGSSGEERRGVESTKQHIAATPRRPKKRTAIDKDLTELIDFFRGHPKRESVYVPSWGRDKNLLRPYVKSKGVSRIREMLEALIRADEFLESNGDFNARCILDAPVTIPGFVMVAGRMDKCFKWDSQESAYGNQGKEPEKVDKG